MRTEGLNCWKDNNEGGMDMPNIDVLTNIFETKYFLTDMPFSGDMKLKEDLGFDSLTLVNLIVDIEEALDIEFDISLLEPGKMNTLGDLLRLMDVAV